MKEKYIFFIGLGTGLVVVSIISLFLYNVLKVDNNTINIATSTTVIESTTEATSIQNNTNTIIESTTKDIKIEMEKNMEISTYKPFEISTN
ncbi:hypothetical protein [[Clostridium] colinum]|uniref:hypothetical protein n=1 Tax=[Clostridium] colinum TaxID=36835 RepID=UPI0020258F2F|nr:hypothetical protein [[Clostridium] colinum]